MRNATILVVDDEPLIRWSLTERLTADGHRVLEAGTGWDALGKLPSGIELVLLDHRLPDIDGIAVLRRIRAYDERLPVMLMTAFASPEMVSEAAALGASSVLDKPFNLDDVAADVQEALASGPRARRVRPVAVPA